MIHKLDIDYGKDSVIKPIDPIAALIERLTPEQLALLMVMPEKQREKALQKLMAVLAS